MWRKMVWANLFIAGLVWVGGCAEQEKKINELTLNKQELEAQLSEMKGKLDDKQAELSKCQDQLAQLKAERDALQRQLAALRDQPPPGPGVPAGWEIRKGMAMTSMPEAVLFDPGKTDLKRSAYSKLSAVIRQIKTSFPGQDIYIVGHTDSDPIRRSKWKDNLELSLHRSAAVTRYLVSNGLSSKQVIAAGAGQYRPVASNASSQGKMRNRRVEFWVLKPM